jgi:hypothetical protein
VAGNPNNADERRPFSFPEWKEALGAAALTEVQRAAYRRAILGFLHRCKTARAPATVALAKAHLAECAQRGDGGEREALRWFFRRGAYKAAPAELPAGVAPARQAAGAAESAAARGAETAGVKPAPPRRR